MKQTKAEFSLRETIPSKGFWTIDGVLYRNNSTLVDLCSETLPEMTLKEFLKHRKEVFKQGEFYAESLPFCHAVIKTLYLNRDNPNYKNGVEEVRLFLNDAIENYLRFLSSVTYRPEGKKDLVNHYGLQSRIKHQENIFGPDGLITKINLGNELQVILGSSDIDEINQVYKWITGKNVYLWRVNIKPEQDTEKIVGFFSYANETNLDCYGIPDVSYGALAVRENFNTSRKINFFKKQSL